MSAGRKRCGTANVPADEEEYRPFPRVTRRNSTQRLIEVPLFVRALGLPRGGRVLEIGCGEGAALPPFAELLAPRLLVGVDIEFDFLHEFTELEGREPFVHCSQADARTLPFADATFDLVADFGTCYHIARRRDALSEIARVLVPGGLFATETKLSQLLSHPFRTRGRRLDVKGTGRFVSHRNAGLWAAYRRVGEVATVRGS